MEINQHDWEKFFPFENVRSQQIDAIDAILNAFLNDQKKFFVLQGETGVGKSAIAITVARFLNSSSDVFSLEQPGAYVLTTQKILQQQYIDDFEKFSMRSIKSSSSYPCQRSSFSNCGEVRRLVKVLKERCDPSLLDCKHDCTYLDEKNAFLASPLSVTNYSYFFSETMYAGKLKPRQLLICDEAHNIENALSNHIEISFSNKFSRNVLQIDDPSRFDLQTVVEWIRRSYKPSLLAHIAELSTKIMNVVSLNASDDANLSALAKENEKLDKHICKVNRFLADFDESNWILNVDELDKERRSFTFKPVDVSRFSEERLFRFGQKILCMSATILDNATFCRSVGIPASDAEHLIVPSPFAIENRLVHFMPVGSMSRKCIDETLPKLVEAVRVILEQHKNEKGIIHAASFKVANYIKSHVCSKRLLLHDADNRSQVLEHHKMTDKPTVLLSPSMAEGVDLVGDCSRFQIVCKIPYPSLSDAVIVKRMQNDATWYALVTARTLIQSLGRSVRNEHDHAVSYILDKDWERFYAKNKHMFSGDFSKLLR